MDSAMIDLRSRISNEIAAISYRQAIQQGYSQKRPLMSEWTGVANYSASSGGKYMRIRTWIVAGLSMAALVGVVGWAWADTASLTKHRQPQRRLRRRR